MFLKLVGPPLHQFQPLPYVKSWLAKGHHAATDINSIAHQDQQDDKETEISTTSACGSLSSRVVKKRPAAYSGES